MGRYGNVVTGPKKTPANTVKNSMFSRAPQTPPRIASRPKPWPVRSSIPISGQPLGAGEQKAIAQSQTARSPEAFRRTPPATVSRFSPEAARRTPPATVSAPPPRPVQRPGQPTATSAPPPTSPEAFRRTPPATVGGFSPEAARRTPPATVSRFSPEAARRTPPATTASRYPSPEALKRPPPATVGTPTTRSPEAARAGTISSRLTNPADIAMLNFARRAGSGTTGMPTADRAMIDFARRAGSGTTGTPTTRSPEAARAGTTGAATNPNYDMGGPFPNATNPDFDMGGLFPNAPNLNFDMRGPFPNASNPDFDMGRLYAAGPGWADEDLFDYKYFGGRIKASYGRYLGGFQSSMIPVMAHGGEYVMSARAVQNIGLSKLESMNHSKNYQGGGGGGTNIFVENFIGEPEWFESMMGEYNVSVAPKNERSRGLESRKISSMADNNRRGRV